eukprot:XP_001704405.1 Hypothetical protein GL50803_18879 [Giardia lamblia ATCC 50803]
MRLCSLGDIVKSSGDLRCSNSGTVDWIIPLSCSTSTTQAIHRLPTLVMRRLRGRKDWRRAILLSIFSTMSSAEENSNFFTSSMTYRIISRTTWNLSSFALLICLSTSRSLMEKSPEPILFLRPYPSLSQVRIAQPPEHSETRAYCLL